MARGRPMSAQETMIAELQRQLHEENRRRFEQIEVAQREAARLNKERFDNTETDLTGLVMTTAVVAGILQDK